ncbi:MAG: glycosyltransferase family 1 protein [bacterium (Candidatus Ratteibacteria) CG_4_10_14_3_um_filter_41_18]|uniref:Glycosyltransferase family 1 protein n=4 Tax=Candidatus Ratteibacteria TaxID=2979319 RepID=A0A2M7EA99_9BACT|nr:MAG: hypothetical protein AUJ76_02640 [Candidatus Omnitrophica bacterium CG1_02_41_171]PIV64639.1 MAG: glycosyltransferase family 1 protein [bacterium (Candidatus Ratteibacteria) CG01_land_8_20_14_3_00_40_19]PIW32971.1 MAG: glycosyltransferase family 1 protein [bacterium (Candidatus Ratteibacteria) CG15_BIG_FIL_POST_REV_8_21_14_020_41_12]PIX76830.1 MAG: glycosyltransferase family 1 protein [bacterium (Candidatus Ratteibacteria) CG_4_10_14_3_um_filter_41_18]PJA61941.1 MAG: glycosyltransferase
MRIGIDATVLPKELGGVGVYLLNLIKALSKIDRRNEYFIFVEKRNIKRFKLDANFHLLGVKNMPRFSRLLWEQTLFPFLLRKCKIELLHSPRYTTPLMRFGWKSVVSFHDMLFLLFPKKHSILKRLFYGRIMPAVAKKAERIIAVSSSTKKDIMELLNTSSEKIAVIHLGIDFSSRPIEKKNLQNFRKKYQILNPYLLYVGTLKKRKNILNLLRAYKKVKEKDREERLIIVGRKSKEYQNIHKTVKELGLEKDVFFTDYVDEKLLPFYYSCASVFVYLSLYEGFGLPVLEAMVSGTPVIVSNSSSLPEVAGKAAIFVDPHNIEEIAEAMQKVLGSKELAWEMREKGLERAKLFSWQECAKKTLNLYEEITGE